MRIIATDLPDVFIIEMKVFADDRGSIKELWNAPRYLNHGLGVPSVQTNFSRSRKGVIRGLHYQEPHGQGKLVSVVAGEVFDQDSRLEAEVGDAGPLQCRGDRHPDDGHGFARCQGGNGRDLAGGSCRAGQAYPWPGTRPVSCPASPRGRIPSS